MAKTKASDAPAVTPADTPHEAKARALWRLLWGEDPPADALAAVAGVLRDCAQEATVAASRAERAACAEVARRQGERWQIGGGLRESAVCLGVAEKIEGRGK